MGAERINLSSLSPNKHNGMRRNESLHNLALGLHEPSAFSYPTNLRIHQSTNLAAPTII
jgi:hypothetical protein